MKLGSQVLKYSMLAFALAVPLQGNSQSIAGTNVKSPTQQPNSAAPATYDQTSSPADEDASDSYLDDAHGSAYIPLDSWMYPAALRLHSLGFVDSVFVGIRPWTRRSLLHILQRSSSDVLSSNDNEAIGIYESLRRELTSDGLDGASDLRAIYGIQSVYTRGMGIAGPPIRDSFHLGSSIVNDYGRPYAQGFNNVTGFSSLNEAGRFSLYIRAEYQHAPASNGYTLAQAQPLASDDTIIL